MDGEVCSADASAIPLGVDNRSEISLGVAVPDTISIRSTVLSRSVRDVAGVPERVFTWKLN